MSKVIGILALLWAGLLCTGIVRAQETVNGSPVVMGTLKAAGAQSAVDFTAAGTTAPVKTGLLAARPSNCTPGQLYFATDATAGQNLYYCPVTNNWTQQLNSGGGGASMASQLGDFTATRTSPTVLTIGANCSVATPCNVRQGSQVYSFMSPATATLSAGTGVAYVYVDAGGVLTIGHNLTLVCSACTATAAVTSFPMNSVPIYTWTGTTGAWDVSGGVDKRALLNGKTLIAGTAILITESGPTTKIDVNIAALPAGGGTDITHNGSLMLSGYNGGSGSYTLAVADAAGTPIVMIAPTTNGAANQVKVDSGSVTCPAHLPTSLAGIPCHQEVWQFATASNLSAEGQLTSCQFYFGNDNGSALLDADLGQKHYCMTLTGTVVEVDIEADAGGTPSLMVTRDRANGTTAALLTGVLASGAAGIFACSNTGATASLFRTAVTCSGTLQNTAILIGDQMTVGTGTANSAKKVIVTVWYKRTL